MRLKEIKNHVLHACSEVFAKKKYLVILSCVTLALILINVSVINYQLFFDSPSLNLITKTMLGTLQMLSFLSVFLLLLTSLLTGVFVSLFTYRVIELNLISDSIQGSAGAFLGALAPSCSTCGIGLAMLLGFGGMLAQLPFKGLEIGFLGIVLLLLSIASLSKKITEKTCKIGG